jgi:hypothetical protein
LQGAKPINRALTIRGLDLSIKANALSHLTVSPHRTELMIGWRVDLHQQALPMAG